MARKDAGEGVKPRNFARGGALEHCGDVWSFGVTVSSTGAYVEVLQNSRAG